MKQYIAIVEKEKSRLWHFNIQRVPRGDNEEANRFAKLVSSASENLAPGIIIEHLPRPSIKAKDKEVNMNSLKPEWVSQIIRYLKNGQLLEDNEVAKKVKTRASRYLFLDDTLYKKSFTIPLLRCLSEEEADYVLREIHEGIYGSHSRGRSIAHKAIRAMYYWPFMQKDDALLAQRCDKC